MDFYISNQDRIDLVNNHILLKSNKLKELQQMLLDSSEEEQYIVDKISNSISECQLELQALNQVLDQLS